MRKWMLVGAHLLFAAIASAQSSLTMDAIVSLRGMNASGPATWLEGGGGRLDASRDRAFGTVQLGADWDPSEHFDAHVQLLGRAEPSSYGGRRAGVVEAFVEGRAGGWLLRAGQFFLPTSRENTASLWSSPYTLSLSAWNSWIAHEFRPIGADLQWRRGLFTAGATAFRGNDTSGTLIGWRGWTIGSRLSVYGERLPVAAPAAFTSQREGTTAYGRDLDGRTGFAGRVRVSSPDRALLQFAHVDNRGDRELYGGQYSWQTRFSVVSGELGSTDGTKLAAEYAFGKTGMGFAPAAFVQEDFYAAYLLLSHKIARNRFSARFDTFATLDRDHSIGGNGLEHGKAWVLAWLYDFTPQLRGGAEFAQVTGQRDGAIDGRSVTAEVRWAWR